jgi:DNA-binding SARP family transcriptional activator/TolB-like protein
MIELRCFGGAELRSGSEDTCTPTSLGPKRLALLSYLAVAGAQRPISRDKLLALFWPESDTERARATLRSTLHLLRRDLGDTLFLVDGGQTVALDRYGFWCDVQAFREGIAQGGAREALELYTGDFLDGFFLSGAPDFERWVDDQREDLRRMAVEAAWTLARRALGSGSRADAGHWARRAFGLRPLDEDALRRLLRLKDEIGDRQGALQAYERFAERLAEEFEAEPAPETQALVSAIRGRLAVHESAPHDVSVVNDTDWVSDERTAEGVRDAERSSPIRHPRTSGARWASDRRLRWLGSATVVLGVLGIAAWLSIPSSSTDAAPPTVAQPSIVAALGLDAPVRATLAVLPFDDSSDDPSMTYIARGLTADIRAEVAKVGTLRVLGVGVPGPVSYPAAPTLSALADSVGADVLLAGTVRLLDGRMRITVELVDGASEEVLWADTHDEPVEHVFDLQDRVAISVAEALEVTASQEEVARISEIPTSNEKAYFDYLRARDFYLVHQGEQPEPLDSALALVDGVLSEDPDFAAARALRASVLHRSTVLGVLPESWSDSATVESDRALELAPDDPFVLTVWAGFISRGERNRAEVRRALERALRTGSDVGGAAAGMLVYELSFSGELVEAVDLAHWRLANHGTRGGAHHQLARLYLQLGEIPQSDRCTGTDFVRLLVRTIRGIEPSSFSHVGGQPRRKRFGPRTSTPSRFGQPFMRMHTFSKASTLKPRCFTDGRSDPPLDLGASRSATRGVGRPASVWPMPLIAKGPTRRHGGSLSRQSR